MLRSSGISRKSAALNFRYSQKKKWLSIFFYCSENPSIAHNLGTTGLIQVGFSVKCTSLSEHFNQIENWKCHMCESWLIPLDRITNVVIKVKITFIQKNLKLPITMDYDPSKNHLGFFHEYWCTPINRWSNLFQDNCFWLLAILSSQKCPLVWQICNQAKQANFTKMYEKEAQQCVFMEERWNFFNFINLSCCHGNKKGDLHGGIKLYPSTTAHMQV